MTKWLKSKSKAVESVTEKVASRAASAARQNIDFGLVAIVSAIITKFCMAWLSL